MPSRARPSVYLDSCCFIDAVKEAVGNLPADRHDDVWHIKKLLQAHHNGDLEVVTSFLSIGECVAVEPGQVIVPEHVQEHFRRLLTSGQYLTLLPQTPRTGQIVQELRWKQGILLKGQDSLHVASAIEHEVKEFISTDDRLRRPKMVEAANSLINKGIRFTRASGTRLLPDDYRQGDILNA